MFRFLNPSALRPRRIHFVDHHQFSTDSAWRLQAVTGSLRYQRPAVWHLSTLQQHFVRSNSSPSQKKDQHHDSESESSSVSINKFIAGIVGSIALTVSIAYQLLKPEAIELPGEFALRDGARLQSLEEIRGIISKHQHEANWGHVGSFAANPQIEDTFKVKTRILDGAVPGLLAGVYDGHSGRAASAFCRDRLFDFIEKHFQQSKQTDPSKLLAPEAFLDADAFFLESNFRNRRFEDGLSGACAVVAHVMPDKVVTAHAGDCRAIVGRKITSPSGQVSWQSIDLTRDHQIENNNDERLRLITQHPREPDIIQKNRVKGRLQPTRGIGDGMYKQLRYFTEKSKLSPDLGARYRATGWFPPYTTAAPEISQHNIAPNDEFLVLATDGLFSDMTSQQVVDYMGEYMDHVKGTAQEQQYSASSWLIEKALLHAGQAAFWQSYLNTLNFFSGRDQAARIQPGEAHQTAELPLHVQRMPSNLELLSWTMQLPASRKRLYHDDCTVVSVWLQKQS